METTFTCPACGFPGLLNPPWTGTSASDDICPSCGIQFGYHDARSDGAWREGFHRGWGQKWFADGARWHFPKAPDGWDGLEQYRQFLQDVELTVGSWLSPDERALFEALADLDPELAAVVQDHVDYYEMVLSTILLSDVVRWANGQFVNGEDSRVTALLNLLEDRFNQGDRYVRDLIAVGFVESMDSTGEPAAGLRDLLGPSLRNEYSVVNH